MSYVVTNTPSASMYQAMKYTKIKMVLLSKSTQSGGEDVQSHTRAHTRLKFWKQILNNGLVKHWVSKK